MPRQPFRGTMLKVRREANGAVLFVVSGRLDSDSLPELETVLAERTDGRCVSLDLRDLTLVDENAVRSLERWEARGIRLKNCPAYIREWIEREPKQ